MTNTQALTHEYLTIDQIRSYLNISRSTAYELAHRRDFPTCRFGRTIRIPREPFLKWVKTKTRISGELASMA